MKLSIYAAAAAFLIAALPWAARAEDDFAPESDAPAAPDLFDSAPLDLWGAAAPAPAEKQLGIGLALGEPTGFTCKAYMTEQNAVDAFVGGGWMDGSAAHLSADFLWEFDAYKTPKLTLRWYAGPGLRMRVRSGSHRDDDEDDVDFGPRILGGVCLKVNRVPVEFFVETAPGIDLVHPKFTIDACTGVRWYF
jgi:hypothetical protein